MFFGCQELDTKAQRLASTCMGQAADMVEPWNNFFLAQGPEHMFMASLESRDKSCLCAASRRRTSTEPAKEPPAVRSTNEPDTATALPSKPRMLCFITFISPILRCKIWGILASARDDRHRQISGQGCIGTAVSAWTIFAASSSDS